jgi:uncharacterized protein (TIGR03435 family)
MAMQAPRNAEPEDTTGPSVFTVFQQQLGIQVKGEKGPVETLVVERVEKPSVN